MVTLTPWWKKGKNEETKPIFESQKHLAQFTW